MQATIVKKYLAEHPNVFETWKEKPNFLSTLIENARSKLEKLGNKEFKLKKKLENKDKKNYHADFDDDDYCVYVHCMCLKNTKRIKILAYFFFKVFNVGCPSIEEFFDGGKRTLYYHEEVHMFTFHNQWQGKIKI